MKCKNIRWKSEINSLTTLHVPYTSLISYLYVFEPEHTFWKKKSKNLLKVYSILLKKQISLKWYFLRTCKEKMEYWKSIYICECFPWLCYDNSAEHHVFCMENFFSIFDLNILLNHLWHLIWFNFKFSFINFLSSIV